MSTPKLVQGYEVVIGFETHTQLSTQSKIKDLALGRELDLQPRTHGLRCRA